MQANPKKVKFIIFSAIALAVVLFVCCICLLFSIGAKKKQIEQQEKEIQKLNNQIESYQSESTSPDNNIIIED